MKFHGHSYMVALGILLVGAAACSFQPSSPQDAGSQDTSSDVTVDKDEPDTNGDINQVDPVDTPPDPVEPDAAAPDAEPGQDGDTDDEEVSCIADPSEATSCHSGHTQLDSWEPMILKPDGMEYAGCSSYTDHSSFQSFEPTTWTIQGCPDTTHRFMLELRDCHNRSFPAYLTIEPVDPSCNLEDHATLSFSPQEGSTDISCVELQRNHFCYYEEPHDEGGGYDWTLMTRDATSWSDWLVYLDVDWNWNAHVEYRITAHVPPLE